MELQFPQLLLLESGKDYLKYNSAARHSSTHFHNNRAVKGSWHTD